MESANFDKSRLMPIRIRRGQTVDFDIPVKNADGTDYDFTDHDAELLVYSSFSKSDTPILSFKTSDGTMILTTGNINLNQPEPLDFKKEDFVYVLWITDETASPSNREPWTNGPFVLLNREWDNANTSGPLTINLASPVILYIGSALDIIAEAAARAAADLVLQQNITAEANARALADNTLQTNITNEASARATADSTLQTNIDNIGSGISVGQAQTMFTTMIANLTQTQIDDLRAALA